MKAREDYAKNAEVEYLDVVKNKDLLEEMLKLSDRRREVPVIVIGSEVKIGHGGT
jgi:glutaredoxin